MILMETKNAEEIKSILLHPEIYETIAEDGACKAHDYEPPTDRGNLYIGGYVNNKIMAIMNYNDYKDGQECHVQVLPSYRKDYSEKFGIESLKFRNGAPLYAEIPDLYKNVLSFALANNFKVIDTIKSDYTKDGKTYDMQIMRFDDGEA